MPSDDASEPLSGSTDQISQWTIKAIPVSIRNAAITAARAEGLTTGQWLERTIRDRLAGGTSSPAPASTRELAELLSASAAFASAMATGGRLRGVPGLSGLLRERIRAARGQPLPEPRRVAGPAAAVSGEWIEAASETPADA